jgi:hypothetical protein
VHDLRHEDAPSRLVLRLRRLRLDLRLQLAAAQPDDGVSAETPAPHRVVAQPSKSV